LTDAAGPQKRTGAGSDAEEVEAGRHIKLQIEDECSAQVRFTHCERHRLVRLSGVAASLKAEGAAGAPNLEELAMNPNDCQARLDRLQRECEVSACPAILLLAACSGLVLMLALSFVTY
jgi:hypothetical protein